MTRLKLRYMLILRRLEFSYQCRPDVFMLLTDPNDDGTLLPFLIEYLGKEYEGLFYHISCEADYIGETNDKEGKYFNLEDYDY